MQNFDINFKFNSELLAKEIDIENKLGESEPKKTNIFIKLFTGAIIGFVNGFFGGGGGMVCVPLLSGVIKMPEKKSHATTILIMLPLCIASLVVYSVTGNLNFNDAWQVGIGFVVGGLIGALLLSIINNVWLGLIFSLVIIYGGIKMIL